MNLSQKIVLLGWAAAVLFFSIFFVPFDATLSTQAGIQHQYYNAPVWTTEILYQGGGVQRGIRINTQRWLMELFVPTIIAGALFFAFGRYSAVRKKENGDS